MTRDIGFLIFEGFQILDAAGPIAAFEIGGAHQRGAYRLNVVAKTAGAVASSSGATMTATRLAEASRFDTLVVAGGLGTYEALKDEATLAYLRQRRAIAARRQRLLGRVPNRGGRPARRQARDDPLEPQPAVRAALSRCAAGTRPHLRSRRRDLEFGRDHRRRGPRPGADRR